MQVQFKMSLKPHSSMRLAYILHDYELYHVSRPTRSGSTASELLETVRTVYSKPVKPTSAWQGYWVDLFGLSVYNRLYIHCSPMEQNRLMLAFRLVSMHISTYSSETITFGGNTIELLSDVIRLGGHDVYKVRTLDGNRLPPDPLEVNHNTYPHLIPKATVSQKWNGREDVVTPLQYLDGADVPVPFMGDGEYNYINAERVRVLQDNEPIPTPYRY